jgi:hypothetical protein
MTPRRIFGFIEAIPDVPNPPNPRQQARDPQFSYLIEIAFLHCLDSGPHLEHQVLHLDAFASLLALRAARVLNRLL